MEVCDEWGRQRASSLKQSMKSVKCNESIKQRIYYPTGQSINQRSNEASILSMLLFLVAAVSFSQPNIVLAY